MMMARTAKRVMSPDELQRLLGQEFLMPVEQAALYLCVSASTLNHWRSDGKGPKFVKLCGSSRGAIRYRLGDLRAFVESNTFESVAEAELADAMSRVTHFWDEWGKSHPFIARGPHFLIDSAVADRETYLSVFLDPYAKVVWLKPEKALGKLWCRSERRRELLGLYANGKAHGALPDVDAAYKEAIAQVPDVLWGCHPDLTLAALQEVAGGAPYPVEFGGGG